MTGDITEKSDSELLDFEYNDDDIALELMIMFHDGKAFSKYQGHGECSVCVTELHNTSVLSIGCEDFFHRNCLLKSVEMMREIKCPTCMISL